MSITLIAIALVRVLEFTVIHMLSIQTTCMCIWMCKVHSKKWLTNTFYYTTFNCPTVNTCALLCHNALVDIDSFYNVHKNAHLHLASHTLSELQMLY